MNGNLIKGDWDIEILKDIGLNDRNFVLQQPKYIGSVKS